MKGLDDEGGGTRSAPELHMPLAARAGVRTCQPPEPRKHITPESRRRAKPARERLVDPGRIALRTKRS